MLLAVLLCVGGIATIALIDWTALALGPTGSRKDRYLGQIVLVASYVTPYCIFTIGLVAWLRSRSASAWVPRIIAVGVFFLIAIAPWVAAAIAGALADSSAKSWILIAAPSPFFLVSMLAELGSYAHDPSMTIPTGMIFAIAWGFLGILFSPSRSTEATGSSPSATTCSSGLRLRTKRKTARRWTRPAPRLPSQTCPGWCRDRRAAPPVVHP